MATRALRSAGNKKSNAMSLFPIVAVVGGINMDLVLELERMPILGESLDANSLVTLPGGKGANTAVAAYRACHTKQEGRNVKSRRDHLKEGDIRIFMNGAVGDDAYGADLLQNLEENGVDASGVRTVPGRPSGTCIVLVEIGTGQSRNTGYQGGNLQYSPADPKNIECLTGSTGSKPDLVIAHLGLPRDMIEALLAIAGKSGVDTILNPSPAYVLLSKTYENVTHLILNEQETAELTNRKVEDFKDPNERKKAAELFIEKGVKNVVITLGGAGAYFMDRERRSGHVPAVKDVKVKDETGAGDSFIGAYAVEYIRQKQRGEWHIEKAIAFACKAAARTISQLGAQEALPWADEI